MNNEIKELKIQAQANDEKFNALLNELTENENYYFASKLISVYYEANRIRYKEGAAMVREIYADNKIII